MLEIRSGADCRHTRRYDYNRCRRAAQQPLGTAAQQRPGKTGLLAFVPTITSDRLDILREIGQAVRR